MHRIFTPRYWRRTLSLLVFIVAATSTQPETLAANIGTDLAAKVVYANHMALRYQTYKPSPDQPAVKVDDVMALVVGSASRLLETGSASMAGELYTYGLRLASTDARFLLNNLTPKERISLMADLLKDFVPTPFAKATIDGIKYNIFAAINSADSAAQVSRNRIVSQLEPVSVQDQVNNYYITQIAELKDIAAANAYFAEKFDEIVQTDMGGVSISDNATTILNRDLDLPDYFRTHANPDGSLSIDIAGLKLVYANKSLAAIEASDRAIDLGIVVHQAQRQKLLSNASLREILESVPDETQKKVREQYEINKMEIAKAAAAINLAGKLATFIDQRAAREINVFGNAGLQFASAVNEFSNGELTLTAALTSASNVAGAALAVYGLLQGGPSQDAAIQQQLAALGKRIERMRIEFHERFDILDRKLSILYETIDTNFNAIIPRLDLIIKQLSDLRDELERFERNLYTLEIAGFLRDLDDAITGGIAYRDVHGANLTQLQYDAFENTYYRWATALSRDVATIPGNRSFDDKDLYRELTTPVNNPDLIYFIDGVNLPYLNALALRFGGQALSNSDLVNPSPYAISARSHLQFARENPAFDARLSPTRLTDIINVGRTVEQALKQITAPGPNQTHPLLDNLVANYQLKLDEMATALDQSEQRLRTTTIQSQVSSKLTVIMNGCGGQQVNVAAPLNTFSTVDSAFILGNYLSETGQSGFSTVTPCVDLGVSPDQFLRVYLKVFYGGVMVASVYLQTTNKFPDVNFWWTQLHFNWGPVDGCAQCGNLKTHFENNEGVSAYPCSRSGDVRVCDPAYAVLLAQVSGAVNQNSLYQRNVYSRIVSEFSNGGSDVAEAGIRLAGAKALLQKFLLLGLPHSLRDNDFLRSMLFGANGLVGRTDDGRDEIVFQIFQPALDGLNDNPQPKIDLRNTLQPRVSALSSVLRDVLAQLDRNEIDETHEILSSTLEDLSSYRDAKLANSVQTPTGANVVVQSPQGVTINFPGVVQAGVSVATMTEPGAAFGVPGGFIITPQFAFTVETTAVYSGPVTTCFSFPSITDPAVFASTVVLHSEAAIPILVDRTFSRDFETKTICARTDTLSPFEVGIRHPANTQVSQLPQIIINRVVSRDALTGEVIVRLTLTNAGSLAAANLEVSIARLNGISGTPLPQAVGTLRSGENRSLSFRFSPLVGSPQLRTTLTIAGVYSGGSFNSVNLITLP